MEAQKGGATLPRSRDESGSTDFRTIGDSVAEWFQERRRAGGRRSDAVLKWALESAGSSESSRSAIVRENLRMQLDRAR
jgi:hypothetical protein